MTEWHKHTPGDPMPAVIALIRAIAAEIEARERAAAVARRPLVKRLLARLAGEAAVPQQ